MLVDKNSWSDEYHSFFANVSDLAGCASQKVRVYWKKTAFGFKIKPEGVDWWITYRPE